MEHAMRVLLCTALFVLTPTASATETELVIDRFGGVSRCPKYTPGPCTLIHPPPVITSDDVST